MKKIYYFIAAGVVLAALLALCAWDNYYGYKPYFMKRADLEKSVHYNNTPQQMENPGKIYVYDDTIFVNERYKGVHIIDNSNPRSPKITAFIHAPGCIDMAVKGNIIYLDNAVDLVAFDLTTHRVTKRIKDYFPEPVSPHGDVYRRGNSSDYILVGWKK